MQQKWSRSPNLGWFNFSTLCSRRPATGDWASGDKKLKKSNRPARLRSNCLHWYRDTWAREANTEQDCFSFGAWDRWASMEFWSRETCVTQIPLLTFPDNWQRTQIHTNGMNFVRLVKNCNSLCLCVRHPVADSGKFQHALALPETQLQNMCVFVCALYCCLVLISIERKYPIDGNVSETKMKTFV